MVGCARASCFVQLRGACNWRVAGPSVHRQFVVQDEIRDRRAAASKIQTAFRRASVGEQPPKRGRAAALEQRALAGVAEDSLSQFSGRLPRRFLRIPAFFSLLQTSQSFLMHVVLISASVFWCWLYRRMTLPLTDAGVDRGHRRRRLISGPTWDDLGDTPCLGR